MKARPAPTAKHKVSAAFGEHSESKSPAKLRGEKRTRAVERRITDAIAVMRTEIAQNAGIYPYNKGRVTKAEIARRAKAHPTSFHTGNLDDCRKLADAFVKEIKSPASTSPGGVRGRKKSVAERLAESQTEYELLLQTFALAELEFQEMKAQRDDANEERDQYKAERDEALKEKARMSVEIAQLKQQLARVAGRKVVQMPLNRSR